VLRDDGTVWLNLGDSYIATKTGGDAVSRSTLGGGKATQVEAQRRPSKTAPGLKPKDLVGIPWRVAFALQADGWYLRSDTIEEVELYCPCGCGHVMEERIWRYSQDRDIIWSKPNPMPESVTDRPTKAHEYLFLLSKAQRYYYDADAVREPGAILACPDANKSTLLGGAYSRHTHGEAIPQKERRTDKQRGHTRRHAGFNDRWDAMTKKEQCSIGRNRRTVWSIPTQPTPEAHFAAFPEALVEPCVLAGSAPGDVVLDPFGGTGTTVKVAQRLGRKGIALELSPEYCRMAREKTWQTARQGQMF